MTLSAAQYATLLCYAKLLLLSESSLKNGNLKPFCRAAQVLQHGMQINWLTILLLTALRIHDAKVTDQAGNWWTARTPYNFKETYWHLQTLNKS